MARFNIIHCRRVGPELSEFDVRPFSGEVQVGDTFGFRGVHDYKKFKVLSIRQEDDHQTLECAGTLDFDDEMTRIMLDTYFIVMPPADLPVPRQMPTPTPEEERSLRYLVSDWDTRAPIQRAICLHVLRGLGKREEIARSLGVTTDDVDRALQTVFGITCEFTTKRLLFL